MGYWIVLSWNGPADIENVVVEQKVGGNARIFRSREAANKWASYGVAFDYKAVEIE